MFADKARRLDYAEHMRVTRAIDDAAYIAWAKKRLFPWSTTLCAVALLLGTMIVTLVGIMLRCAMETENNNSEESRGMSESVFLRPSKSLWRIWCSYGTICH